MPMISFRMIDPFFVLCLIVMIIVCAFNKKEDVYFVFVIHYHREHSLEILSPFCENKLNSFFSLKNKERRAKNLIIDRNENELSKTQRS